MFKAPKTITEHPAVYQCNDGFEMGFDYKYDVELNEGWVFSFGRMANSEFGRFNTVSDFKAAVPIRKPSN